MKTICIILVSLNFLTWSSQTYGETPVQVRSKHSEAVLEMTVTTSSGESLVLTSSKPQVLEFGEAAQYTATAPNLEVQGEILPGINGTLSQWKVMFRNTGDRPLLLEPALQWTIQNIPSDAVYWSGSYGEYGVRPVAELSGTERYDSIRRMAPWTGYAAGKYALMAGLYSTELRSYIASVWNRGDSEQSGRIAFVTRIVIDPGQTVPVHFLFGEFSAEFGLERELTQRVHDTVPQAFIPNPAAHPSLYGASAQYWASRLMPDKIPASALLEFERRNYATWDWDYAPFKRTGDLWGHEELWNYTPAIPFEKKIRGVIQEDIDFSKIDRATFLKKREAHFNRNQGRDGLYFFTPGGTWMEKTLATELHPDALTIDKNYRYELTEWVTGYDREVKVLPWFTSVEPVLKADWERIVAAYDICGVALDVCRGGPRYRGPAIEKPIEYRAWDEQGVYIDQGVGIAKYIEFLHTLHPRQSPEHVLAIYGNPETGGSTYMTAARYDGGMFEGPPYHPNYASLPLQRYMIGKKPLTWWGGWLYNRYGVPNYASYDRAHFIKSMQGLADYTILRSFELAGIPTLNYEHGVPQITAILPDLLDTIRLGWQAVFPVHYQWEGQLHTACYGKGLDTLLFYGNPYDDAKPFLATVENARLGDGGSFLFAAWRGGDSELHNQVANGKTQLDFTLVAREPVLHRVVAEVLGVQDLKATTRVVRNEYEIAVTLELETLRAEPITLAIPEYRGYTLSQVKIGDEAISWKTDANGRILLPELRPEEGKLTAEIRYHSRLLRVNREAVRAFRLLDDAGAVAFEVVTDGETKETAMAVEKVRQYVAFYRAVQWNQPQTTLKVLRKEEAPKTQGRQLILQIIPERKDAGVSATENGNLVVQGASAENLEEALQELLGAFDAFYPYTGGFRSTWGMSFDVLKHTGMEGKMLPQRKSNE